MSLSRSGLGPVLAVTVLIAVTLATGCGTVGRTTRPSFSFFGEANPETDPWYRKVSDWQSRARAQRAAASIYTAATAPTVPEAADQERLLSFKVDVFRADERRQLAARVTEWARLTGRKHYNHDTSALPADDHWPTHRELMTNDGDDCDGLDLIAYELLRDFGFPENELFRAVVRRDRDGVNHMVTLWFEDPEDPWVLDVTGAMTFQMQKFSELTGWTPTAMFNEAVQFTVRPRAQDEDE